MEGFCPPRVWFRANPVVVDSPFMAKQPPRLEEIGPLYANLIEEESVIIFPRNPDHDHPGIAITIARNSRSPCPGIPNRWLYEREWRMFASLGKASYEKTECVARVYLGSRIHSTNRKRIKDRLKRLGIETRDMTITQYFISFE
jgi:hypothetical protein